MATQFAASQSFARLASGRRATNPVSSRATALVVRADKNLSGRSLENAVRSIKVPAFVKPAVLAAVTNALMALPASAESGKLFDFNLTLPIMMGEFLLLMIFLDKFWFGPVGDVLDERDKKIRDSLASVGDNSAEIKRLEEEAAEILRSARAQAAAKINEARSEVTAALNAELDAAKAQVDKELDAAFAALEKEKEDALTTLDEQVDKLGADILKRVLPEGVTV